jgi:hypothetical protein
MKMQNSAKIVEENYNWIIGSVNISVYSHSWYKEFR